MKPKSLISINDLTKEDILLLIQNALEIQKNPNQFSQKAQSKILGLLFLEPSTRTILSFSAAMYRLGGDVLTFSQPETSSMVKGETLEDTVKIMSSYCDIIAIRHSEIGTLKKLQPLISIPLISAGEGTGEHPTQTLSDLFTIYKKFKTLDITIAFYGDLKYGRTNHSMILAMSRFGVNIICIAPKELQMPDEYIEQAKKNGANVIVDTDINKYLDKIDVLYVSRLQKERIAEKNKITQNNIVNQKLIDKLKPSAIILHPMPRVDAIDPEIDNDPRAKYFEQAANGVAMRMAILDFYLG